VVPKVVGSSPIFHPAKAASIFFEAAFFVLQNQTRSLAMARLQPTQAEHLHFFH
jgi:hypothetical protein